MDKVLTQNPKTWKFVSLHKPIYSYHFLLGHPANEDGQNAAFVPIINKHHVDIVFQSHNHHYERLVPSNCKNGGSSGVCPVSSADKGTIFITSGGGGAFPILQGGTDQIRLAVSVAYHYMMLEIKNNKLFLQAIDEAGNIIDKLNLEKPLPAGDPCKSVLTDAGIPTDMQVGDLTTSDLGTTHDGTVSADGGISDSYTGSDYSLAGETPPEEGCDCQIGSSTPNLPPLLLLLLFVLLRRRR